MNINSFSIYTTIIILVVLLTVPTIHKVNQNHESALYEVTNKKIIEAAITCKNKELCKNEKITLSELYKNKLLTDMVDPITKQVYSSESYVIKQNSEYVFVVEN